MGWASPFTVREGKVNRVIVQIMIKIGKANGKSTAKRNANIKRARKKRSVVVHDENIKNEQNKNLKWS